MPTAWAFLSTQVPEVLSSSLMTMYVPVFAKNFKFLFLPLTSPWSSRLSMCLSMYLSMTSLLAYLKGTSTWPKLNSSPTASKPAPPRGFPFPVKCQLLYSSASSGHNSCCFLYSSLPLTTHIPYSSKAHLRHLRSRSWFHSLPLSSKQPSHQLSARVL